MKHATALLLLLLATAAQAEPIGSVDTAFKLIVNSNDKNVR